MEEELRMKGFYNSVPSEWDPTENSWPRASSDRFIMVLNRGVMNAAAQHASISDLLSESVYCSTPALSLTSISSFSTDAEHAVAWFMSS